MAKITDPASLPTNTLTSEQHSYLYEIVLYFDRRYNSGVSLKLLHINLTGGEYISVQEIMDIMELGKYSAYQAETLNKLKYFYKAEIIKK